MGYLALAATLLAASIFAASALSPLRRRRQLFREQVLPHSGGKIPEDAFRSDRLALNRLNKEGIAIPDGVLLEARHREAHFPSHRHDPDIDAAIVKLVQRPDGRYAPPEGRYPFNNLVESTYVIRPPINIHGYGGIPPRKPVQATLQLPAKPFFADDSEDSNIDLLNTINQEFPGTRLWTGFGPLFHETTNRILRHSGAKTLSSKRQGEPKGNHILPEGGGEKQTAKPIGQSEVNTVSPSTTSQAPRAVQSSSPASPAQAEKNPHRQAMTDLVSGSAIARARQAEGAGFRVVNGIVVRKTQPLRPGPVVQTHLTAPLPGYPSLYRIPKTSFVCRTSSSRKMESDPQANCQVFHLCHPNGVKESFLCPVGSRYDAKSNLCSPWTNVPCPGDP